MLFPRRFITVRALLKGIRVIKLFFWPNTNLTRCRWFSPRPFINMIDERWVVGNLPHSYNLPYSLPYGLTCLTIPPLWGRGKGGGASKGYSI